MNIQKAAGLLRARRITAVELANTAIGRIDRLNAPLHAFITITADYALHRAQQADAELAAGLDRGALHGIPVAVKDLFAMRGVRNTDGSKIYENFVPSFHSTVVARLEAAGAVILGKLNQHELAYGITSANPHFGAVKNPWDLERSPGGSSGGSGAAVAAQLVYAALGSDTGGSVRIPASFCGTVGLKPTYGRVSRYGVLPLAYTLDHVGPLARSVRDAAVMLNAIAGHDPNDGSSSPRPITDYVPEEGCSIRGLRIGFPENFFFEALDPDVESAVRGAIARAGAIGAHVKPVWLPNVAGVNAVGRIILLAEAAAALEPHLAQRHRFGADVMALLDQGRLIPATDYVNAQRLRRKFMGEYRSVWEQVDCLIAPTTPNTAPLSGDTTVRLGGRDEDVRLATTRLVRSVNVLGYPALSMPCGLSSSAMPIGLQIIGPPFAEELVLRVGAALEDSGIVIPPCALT